MSLTRLLQAAGLLLAIYAGILLYNHYFKSEDTLDHRLGKQAYATMLDRDDVFKDHVTGIELVEPGTYNLQTQGLTDSHTAGNIAYNSMAVLVMTKWKMQASRHIFTIYGYDGDELIFEVTNTQFDEPIVTLRGKFEGDEYSPAFGPQTSAPPSIRNNSDESSEPAYRYRGHEVAYGVKKVWSLA